MGIFYRSEHRILFASFAIKSTFVVVEVALAIAFGVCGRHIPQRNASAILEWGMSLSLSSSHQFDFGVLTTTVIAFVFTGYILSFVVDLLPSVRTRRHVPQGEKRSHAQNVSREQEMGQAVIEEPLTMDSTGPAAGYYRGQRI